MAICPYIKSKKSVDLTAMVLARKVDEQGLRTVGVLTKVDKAVDNIYEIKRLLAGVGCQSEGFGFIATKTRDFGENKRSVSIRDAFLREIEYFDNNQDLRLFSRQLGTSRLYEIIQAFVDRHVRSVAPTLIQK